MATRNLLAELAEHFQADRSQAERGLSIELESTGGVEAAKRVKAGENFDLVILAANAIDELIAAGHLKAGSRADLVASGVGVAVRAQSGADRPDISTEAALRQSVVNATSIGYSTGPSGTQLLELFERWGIAQSVKDKLIQAPPGTPVGVLVADGRAALGFQQISELLGMPRIDFLGPMPRSIQINTIFSAGIGVGCVQVSTAQAWIEYINAPQRASIKLRHGMEPT
jgi:molybdate transport system substrate-binding protein